MRSHRMLINYISIFASVLALLPAVAFGWDAVLDDLDTALGWSGPIYSYGFTWTGDGAVADGLMRITHYPQAKYHSIDFLKNYSITLEPNTWVHFRFKENEMLIGADAYFEVDLDGTRIALFGINGEQHWVRDGSPSAGCVPKVYDDEMFIGSSVINGVSGSGKNNDCRVNISNTLVKYTDWHVMSVKYEVSDGVRRIRFLVDGRDIVYRDIDCIYPGGVIDNQVDDTYQPTGGTNTLTVRMSIITDGDEYADTSMSGGTRWYHAYAQYTPALPSYLAQPANQIKADWMSKYDAVSAIYSNSTAINNGIAAGTIDMETAVLMGAISLPGSTDPIWSKYPAGTRAQIQNELYTLYASYPASMPMYKRYIHQKAYETGTTSRAVFFMYLTPEEARTDSHWQYLSAQEQSEIPELATLKDSTMYWDYVILASSSNLSQLKPGVKNLIFDGRMTPQIAIFTEMLSWQEAEIFSQWMSQYDISEVQAHSLGSPSFGTHGFISGTVKDSSGNPVSGAAVHTALGGYTATTADDGSYNILTVDPGSYALSAAKSGYDISTLNNITVTARQTTTADFTVTSSIPPTGNISINAGNAYTNSSSVSLSISANGSSSMRFMNSGSSWSSWEPLTTSRKWTLSSGSGSKTVYAQFKNDAGTTSPTYSDSITLDTIAPSIPAKPTCAGAFTTATSVSWNWGASVDGGGSGIAGYMCQIGSIPGGSDVFNGDIENTLNKVLTGSYGSYYYCRVRAVDKAGNMSSWAASADGITPVENVETRIGAIKSLPNLASVGISSVPVTAVFGDCFYIEDISRAAGIRVQPVVGLSAGLVVGSTVDIGGVLKTDSNGERFIEATVLVKG